MDASSLIFVLIIGIWAVYLVQHWVRRREQMVTSRSVDRFSADLRILERRAPSPVALRMPALSVSTASTTTAAVAAPARTTSARTSTTSSTAPESEAEMSTMSAAPVRHVRPRRSHRVRALTFLTVLIATPIMWAAHVFGTLLLWPALAVTAALVLMVMVMRRAATIQRRMAARERLRAASGRRPEPMAGRSRAAGRSGPALFSPARAAAATGTPSAAPAEVSVGVASVSVEVEVAAPVHSQEAVTEVIVLDGGWEPVKVPPPTYTLKPKAERPAAAASTVAPESDSAPSRDAAGAAASASTGTDKVIELPEDELDLVLERRRAAGA